MNGTQNNGKFMMFSTVRVRARTNIIRERRANEIAGYSRRTNYLSPIRVMQFDKMCK